MKHIEIEANGYTFDVAIDETTPLGEYALTVPLDKLIDALIASAVSVDLCPENLEEMNAGGTAVVYSMA